MVEDEEGFEYPVIDETKCVRCYMCLKVCPFKMEKAV
ncbi:4Fe-4S binding protein [uncultured Faecalibacterium sp.]|nr:4Fe-4S binding protein [uncultured Faecalibacterium sp.]